MKYANILIGIIVLIVVLGLVFALVPRTPRYAVTGPNGVVAYRSYNMSPVAYQASVLGTTGYPVVGTQSYVGTQVVTASAPAAASPLVAAGYPYPGNTYGTVPAVPVVPVVWYTGPSGVYRYNYTIPSTQQTVVYPGQTQVVQPGSTQIYSYNNPGVSYGNQGYQYQYQYSQGSTQNSNGWYQ